MRLYRNKNNKIKNKIKKTICKYDPILFTAANAYTILHPIPLPVSPHPPLFGLNLVLVLVLVLVLLVHL